MEQDFKSLRLLKVKQSLSKKSLDAILVSSIPNIIYLAGFSGFSKEEREAFLLIIVRPTRSKASRPTRSEANSYIFTDARYSEEVKKYVSNFKLVEISYKHPFKKALKELIKKEKIKKIGIEEHNISISEYKSLFNGYYTKHYNIDDYRIIKDSFEIANIKKACDIVDITFNHILGKIKQGLTEKELAFEIELFIKKQGADISFAPIVAFGKNSAIPHHKPTNQRLKIKDQILLDFGAKVDNYCSDMTRTIFLGKANNEQKNMYQTVLNAQQKAIEFLFQQYNNLTIKQFNLKIKASEVDKVSRNYIISKGYPSIPHSLGHGVGLEIHESPRLSPISKDILKPGMVFSIEPGIYLPNKFGIRIEDLVVLEKSGPKLLIHSKRELVEL